MIHQKIEKLIPFISEEFITYPLWEEGKYIPFVNFWQKTETDSEIDNMHKRLDKVFKNTGYFINYSDNNSTNTIHSFQVTPDIKELDNGVYEFIKQDWSIEEIIELLATVLK